MKRAGLFLTIGLAVVISLLALTSVSGSGHSSALVRRDPGIQQDADTGPAPTPTSSSTSPTYLVLIVLDGARPDYFKISGIPHVKALIQRGTSYQNAWASILESETPPGHMTIATGSEPRAGLIPGFSWAEARQYQTIFDPARIRAGDMEKLVRLSGVSTIAGQVKKADQTAKVVALGGYKYYANDALGGPDSDLTMYYDTTPKGWAPVYIPARPAPPKGLITNPSVIAKSSNLPLGGGDHYAMKLASATFKKMHPRVMLMNLPEFDRPLGHDYGGNRDMPGAKTLMRSFDKDLGSLEALYRKAGILDRTVFVLTADHGMMPIYHRVPQNLIPDTITNAGGQIVYDNYSTGGYIWLKNPGKDKAAATAVTRLNFPYIQSVYYRAGAGPNAHYVRASSASRFRAFGVEAANQYLLNTFNGSRGPDIVVFASEDTDTIGRRPLNMWKGDHGGANWQAQHLPLFIAGPGVRSGYVSSYPARLEDIAPTVLTLLRAEPGNMQGIPLADAIVQATPEQQTAQKAEGDVLASVIQALKAQSRAELAAKL